MSIEPVYSGIVDKVMQKYMENIVHLMNLHSIPLPDINLFTFSIPITHSGVALIGAPFTRTDIFDESV